jgi:predicted KAP-like P-loop ATPase
MLLVAVADTAWRATKSWIQGLTSGAYLWPFLIALTCFWNAAAFSVPRAATAFGASCVALLVGFAFRLWAAVVRERTVDTEAIKLSATESSYSTRDADAPIASWEEDLLSRSAFVQMMADTILVAKPAVIMLRGLFGDGKSSVLNLLRVGIGKRAIVVPFNSWLPNSQQTLVNDLFGDIAAEINRTYFIPGLRGRLRKLASVLAGTVPQLKNLPEILPPYTQRDEIKDLEGVLARVPKRIVVLLDEIDRMQKDELLTLLKVLRGVTSLQNVTFVCALNPEQVEKVAYDKSDANSHEAMEKFFPTIVDLPPPGGEVLKSLLRNRIAAIFREASRAPQEPDSFHKRFDRLWLSALSDICTNIRKVSLLANDVSAAAALIQGEVDALDVVALLAARRFFPDAYGLIWKNASFFSQSDSW